MKNTSPPRIRWIPTAGSSLKASWGDFVAYRRGRVSPDAPLLVPGDIATLGVQIASNFEAQRWGQGISKGKAYRVYRDMVENG